MAKYRQYGLKQFFLYLTVSSVSVFAGSFPSQLHSLEESHRHQQRVSLPTCERRYQAQCHSVYTTFAFYYFPFSIAFVPEQIKVVLACEHEGLNPDGDAQGRVQLDLFKMEKLTR